jgi:hypothetical protein
VGFGKFSCYSNSDHSSIETLIGEECYMLATYLRDEKKDWMPRIGITA